MARYFRRKRSYGRKNYGVKRRIYRGKTNRGRYRRIAGRGATRGYYQRGITAELKYWDFDCGLTANYPVSGGTELDGWGTDGNGRTLALCNYPTVVAGGGGTTFAGVTNSIFLVNQISQGDDIYQRIGRKINMKSLQFRMSIWASANQWVTFPADQGTNDSFNATVRVMVVYDAQINNTLSINLGDVLKIPVINTAPLSGQQISSYTEAMTNLDNRDRFTTILDKKFNVSATPGCGSKTFNIYKKFKKGGLPVIYSGTQGTSISTGGFWLIVGGSNGVEPNTIPSAGVDPGTDGVGVTFQWTGGLRFRYADA